jgi:hypothetical protein
MQVVDVNRSESCGCKPYLCRDEELDLSDARAIANAESYLASDLESLSIEERERVYNEIHGVTERTEEDPIVVEEKMISLEKEIKQIKLNKAAYERALFLSPRYVNDPEFRLMFLRADNFNAKNAANRMVNYFHYKLELFGEEKLVKKITLKDLTDDDLDEVLSGSFQFCGKDRGNRTVCLVMQKLVRYKTWQSKVCRGV